MQRSPHAVWLSLTLLVSGCIGMGQTRSPFATAPGVEVLPPTAPASPSQVTPQSEPIQTQKPPARSEQDPAESTSSEPSGKPDSSRKGNDPSTLQDAPRWRPLPAPQRSPVEADPSEVDLGKPQKFPFAEHRRELSTQRVPGSAGEAATPITPASQSGQRWQTPLKSTGNRPIKIAQFGEGGTRILILGSIHGNEPESIALVDAVQEFLRRTPPPRGRFSFLVIRTPNPDGLVEHIQTNRNGVDLNRNFPSTWFTTNPSRQTGPHPASEVETQHLMRILRDFRPQRVVHVRSSIGHRPLVLSNHLWRLDQIVDPDAAGYDVGTFDGNFKTGSMEEFVSIRLDTGLATVFLPPQGFQQMTPTQLLQLTVQNVSTMATPQDSKTPKLAPPEDSPANLGAADGAKGYVEFLPPPPHFERVNNASSSHSRESLYYELPPPPR